jgi:hypothetical protein
MIPLFEWDQATTRSHEIMTNTQDEDLLPEYEFDYGKAQPNRFAERTAVAVALQADIGTYLQARA